MNDILVNTFQGIFDLSATQPFISSDGVLWCILYYFLILLFSKLSDECTIDYTGIILEKALADYLALFSSEAIFLTGGLAKAHS